MLILDCSSRTQALHTLSAGFGCPPEKLKKVLLFAQDLKVSTSLILASWLMHLDCRRSALCELGEPGPFTRALWFHGTRTFAGNTFPAGLLALNQSESLAMKMLLDFLAPNEMVRTHLKEWDVPGAFRMRCFSSEPAIKSTGGSGHLVRELHFNASENGLHDYLWLPELVEDVCKAYQKKYGHDLKPHYLSISSLYCLVRGGYCL